MGCGGVVAQTLATADKLGTPGIRFRAGEFNWIGRVTSSVEILITWHTSKVSGIDVVIGFDAGGSYDQYGRLVAKHIGRHLPGSPSVVPQNMPGVAGLRAAAFLYEAAPRDGTALVGAARHAPAADFAILPQIGFAQKRRPARSCEPREHQSLAIGSNDSSLHGRNPSGQRDCMLQSRRCWSGASALMHSTVTWMSSASPARNIDRTSRAR